jgi:hypothetical protein
VLEDIPKPSELCRVSGRNGGQFRQPLEAASIERQNERFDIGPGWRSALVLGHDQTAGMMGGLTEQLALKDTRLSEQIDIAGAG